MIYLYIFIFLTIILTSYILFGRYLNIIDKPNERSSHIKPTVRGGGIIFPIAAFIWFFYSGFEYPRFFLGLMIVSIISFWDDIRPLPIYIRLVFQTIGLFFLFSEFESIQLAWWIIALCILSGVGVVNLYNFMDGINGITAGYSLSVIIGLLLINNFSTSFIDNRLLFFIALSLIVFGIFNLRTNALVFSGDVGAISISYILIFLISILIYQTNRFIFLLFLSVYFIDSSFTIIYRIRNKENILRAHRKHIYQLLVNEYKLPHVYVSFIYSILQLAICFIVFIAIKKDLSQFTLRIIGMTIIISLTFIWIYLRKRKLIIQ